jgi:hypothetical protein
MSSIISEKNKCILKIKEIENIINRYEETIKRLRNQQMSNEFIKSQTDKINKNKEIQNLKLNKLKEQLNDLNSGKIKFIIYEDEQQNIKQNIKQNTKKEIKKEIIKNKEHTQKLNTKYKNNFNHNNNYDNVKKIQSDCNFFFKISNSIPKYIENNLKEMPSNKGYIFKGIWCFGKLPAENNNLTMFEKLPNDILKIHEITYNKNNKNYKIFKKNGKNKKNLISDNTYPYLK